MIKIRFWQKTRQSQSIDEWLKRQQAKVIARDANRYQSELSKLLELAPKEKVIAAIEYYKYLKLYGVETESACKTTINTFFKNES